MKQIRVWDLPLRLFHWALAVAVVVAVVAQKIGGNAMQWHFWAGYTVLALLLFRIVWGFIGPRYARFADFLARPSRLRAYLRGDRYHYPGHNPLGSLSVLALLGVLLFQVGSGLFSNDDIASEGPLAKFIARDLSDSITWLHKEVGATVIYMLVGLHVAAILWYLVARRENLVRPMLTGDKQVDNDPPPSNDSWAVRLLALVIFAACAGAVWWLTNLKAAPLA